MRVLSEMGVARRAPDRRRAARAARLPAPGGDARGAARASRTSRVTTNGFLLERDAAALVDAGIQRFNVSIDSLQRDRFFEITRRDALPQVLRGLEALAAFPQAHPIKVNAVAIRGFTEDEVLPFARFAREHPYEVRFIEFMPLDADHAWTPDQVLTGAEIRAAIDEVYPLEPEPREPSATARVYRFADGQGRIGFIDPVSEPFCGDCDRIRITAEGRLRTCLFSLGETDLRATLRSGASDDELEQRDPRRGLAQGAQAPRQRAGLHPAGAHDVRDRRLTVRATRLRACGSRDAAGGRGATEAAPPAPRPACPTGPGRRCTPATTQSAPA